MKYREPSEAKTVNRCGSKAQSYEEFLEAETIESESIHLILTSVPFSTQYEYSPSMNDLGHNVDNEAFFRQMDFLTPHLYRVLQPGRMCVIHVKDRWGESPSEREIMMNHNIQTKSPDSDECRTKPSLLSRRARELIRMRARQDSDGCHTYQGHGMIAAMLEWMEAELVEEYETAMRRHTRLKEVIGG